MSNENTKKTIKDIFTLPNLVIMCNIAWAIFNLYLTNQLAPLSKSISALEVKAGQTEETVKTLQENDRNYVKLLNTHIDEQNKIFNDINRTLGRLEGRQ